MRHPFQLVTTCSFLKTHSQNFVFAFLTLKPCVYSLSAFTFRWNKRNFCLSDQLPGFCIPPYHRKGQLSWAPAFCGQVWELLFLLGFLQLRSTWSSWDLKTVLALEGCFLGVRFAEVRSRGFWAPCGSSWLLSLCCPGWQFLRMRSFSLSPFCFCESGKNRNLYVTFFSILDKSRKLPLDLTFSSLLLFKYCILGKIIY